SEGFTQASGCYGDTDVSVGSKGQVRGDFACGGSFEGVEFGLSEASGDAEGGKQADQPHRGRQPPETSRGIPT
ncbi:MAG: hypothetical protein D6724_04180, partial [Armatimonadetes bacterium]